MRINPAIALDPSQVHDLRHIRPASDSGARLLSYTLGDLTALLVQCVGLVVVAAVAVVLVAAVGQAMKRQWRPTPYPEVGSGAL